VFTLRTNSNEGALNKMNIVITIFICLAFALCVVSLLCNKIIPMFKDLVKISKKTFCKFLCSLLSFLLKKIGNNKMNAILSLPFKKIGNNQPLSKKAYFEQFGLNTIEDPATGDYIPVSSKDKVLLEAAYQKAWECRNFEIDKSWSRSTYFWGFIALIFTGYVVLLTADPEKAIVDRQYLSYVRLYIILLGFIFSLAWLLVIIGSKALQENWETHIDYLEDLITGPLYKTVFSPVRAHYYSVSKINEVMAFVTILVWAGLYIQYVQANNLYLLLNLFNQSVYQVDWNVTIPLVITIIFSIALIFGYPVTDYNLNKDSLKELRNNGLKGAFIRRDKKNGSSSAGTSPSATGNADAASAAQQPKTQQ
jgi:hypothetical protein